MFGPIGVPELIVIFLVALLVFGPRKLPELGKTLGKGLAEFKRASDDLKRTIEDEIEQGKHQVSEIRDEVSSVRRGVEDFQNTVASAAPVASVAPTAAAAVEEPATPPPDPIRPT